MIIQDAEYLKQVSTDVVADEVEQLHRDLLLEVSQHPNAIGLSAIQIGLPKRAFITLDSPESHGSGGPKSWKLWVNPVIEETEPETMECTEGCLSFPGRSVLTKRLRQITVSAHRIDEWSERERFALIGLDAIIFQHELDHLNGKLMFDRGEEQHVTRHVEPKLGRNDPCGCGSGKKFKKCCGR